MREAVISFGKPITLRIPDGFSYSIKLDGQDCIAEYEEFLIEPQENHAETAAYFMNWALTRGFKQDDLKAEWSGGKTHLRLSERGKREQLLRNIFTEIVSQLKCHLSDREVEDLTRIVAVFDYKEVS